MKLDIFDATMLDATNTEKGRKISFIGLLFLFFFFYPFCPLIYLRPCVSFYLRLEHISFTWPTSHLRTYFASDAEPRAVNLQYRI